MNNHHNRKGLSRSEIVEMVISSLQEVLVMTNGDSLDRATTGEDTYLIGQEAVLDSMGLVTLIVEIEQHLEEEYDVAVVLADSLGNGNDRQRRGIGQFRVVLRCLGQGEGLEVGDRGQARQDETPVVDVVRQVQRPAIHGGCGLGRPGCAQAGEPHIAAQGHAPGLGAPRR